MITLEKLIVLFKGQQRSTDLWVSEWEKHKDAASVRNVSMAIGKLAGVYNVIVSMGMELPDDVPETMIKYNNIWAQL